MSIFTKLVNLIRKKDYDLAHKPEQIGYAFNNDNSNKTKKLAFIIGLSIIIFGFISALILGLIPLYLSKYFNCI